MSAKNEAVVLEFLKAIHQASRPDFDRLEGYFAPDASYHALVPASRVERGAKAIRDGLETQFKTYVDCECEIHNVGSSDTHVFTERSDHVTMLHDGRRVASRVCAVFKVNRNGKIEEWREYWDTGDILKQTGLTQEQLDASMGG
jgi:limonene-1,2-epoxide hydrolase